ncbi:MULTISPECIES: hypothetical protein [Bacillus]|uniref:hypothetical protein n=1 Tax=Bacillus TaxID=1386 RepID=UPI000BB76487|nr:MULTISPECIES: hypothetical protein [Bacillus]
MKTKLYLFGLAIIPWLLIPMLGKQHVKRFLPASLLMGFILIGESLLAHNRMWWWVYKRPHRKIMGEAPLILGPYIMGALLMLRLGYGNILRFFIINICAHLFFVYVLMDWFKSIGFWSLVRMKKYQLFLLFSIEGFILYAMQILLEAFFIRKKQPIHSSQQQDTLLYD